MENPVPSLPGRKGPAVNRVLMGVVPLLSGSAEWHAIYVRYQHERAVTHHLERLGFPVFLPLYREVRRWSDRRKELSRPLFPGYVFFSGGLDRRLEVLNTPGVCSLVMSGGKVAVIPATELEPIGRILLSNASVAPHPFLNAGARIRVRSGPLAGLEGLVVRVKDSMRIVLSVEMLCQSVAVEVDESLVEPLAYAA
jgi:transcription termination/antitermination protein NusG